MASNEVVLQDFSVNFTPTKITIKNETEMEQELESIADKYSGLIVTKNNLKSVKSTRAKLNALNKGLDDKRKEIKSSYNAPLNEFEDKVKGYQAIINKSLEPISDGIKTLESSQREERKAHVQEVINEMAPEYDIDPTEIEIKKSWTNKTMTDIKLTRILSDGFNALKRKKDLFETNKKLVEEHCKYVGVEPAGWVSQLSDEYNATDVIKAIDQAVEDKKQKELAEQKRIESEKAIQESKQQKIDGSVIDTETGEVIQDDIPTEYAVSIQLIGSKVDIIQAIQKINGLSNVTSKVLNPLSAWEG
jgi:ribosomal protein S25